MHLFRHDSVTVRQRGSRTASRSRATRSEDSLHARPAHPAPCMLSTCSFGGRFCDGHMFEQFELIGQPLLPPPVGEWVTELQHQLATRCIMSHATLICAVRRVPPTAASLNHWPLALPVSPGDPQLAKTHTETNCFESRCDELRCSFVDRRRFRAACAADRNPRTGGCLGHCVFTRRCFHSTPGPAMFSQCEVSVPAGAASSAPAKRSLLIEMVFEASTANGAYGGVNYSLMGPQDGQARSSFILIVEFLSIASCLCLLGCGVFPWPQRIPATFPGRMNAMVCMLWNSFSSAILFRTRLCTCRDMVVFVSLPLRLDCKASSLRFYVTNRSTCAEAREDLYGHGLSNAPPVDAWLILLVY